MVRTVDHEQQLDITENIRYMTEGIKNVLPEASICDKTLKHLREKTQMRIGTEHTSVKNIPGLIRKSLLNQCSISEGIT
jgi:hypothetical protein